MLCEILHNMPPATKGNATILMYGKRRPIEKPREIDEAEAISSAVGVMMKTGTYLEV